MALARNVVIRPVDFQLPTLQLPFEQLYDQMQKMQQEKDLFDVMKTMKPQYVEGDKAIVEAGLKEVQSMVSNVAQSFASGKTTDAMRELRDAKTVLTSMWSPTGVFGGVQAYYQEYQKALKEVEEFTKDNTDPAYRYVYKDMVRQSIKEGSGIDPITGKRRTVATPDMTKEVDVLKELDGFLKDWKPDTKTNIERRGQYYYYVGTTEQVPMHEIEKAMSNFMQTPKIDNALNIQAQYRNSIAGEQEKVMTKELIAREHQDKIKQAGEKINIYEKKLKGTIDERKQVQQILGVAPTGILDENTENALAKLKQDIEARSKVDFNKMDSLSLYRYSVEQNIRDAIYDKYAYIKETGKLESDRLALQRNQANAMRNLMLEFSPQQQMPLLGVFGSSELNIASPVVLKEQAGKVYKQSVEQAKQTLPKDLVPMFDNTGQRYAVTAQQFSHAMAQGLRKTGLQNIDSATPEQRLQLQKVIANELKAQGVKADKFTPDQMAEAFVKAGDDGRLSLDMNLTNLSRDYATYKSQTQIVDQMGQEIVNNPTLLDGFLKSSYGNKRVFEPFGPAYSEAGVVSPRKYTRQEVQDLLGRRDPTFLKQLDAYTNDLKTSNPALHKKITGAAVLYGVVHNELGKNNKLLLEGIGQGVGQLVDMSLLTEDQRKIFVEGGQFKTDYTLTNAVVTSRNVNGTGELMLTITGTHPTKDNKAKPFTVTIPSTGFNDREWLRNYVQTQAAVSFDFNRGEPTNQEVFYRSMSQLFDLENSPSAGFDAATVQRLANGKNRPGTYQLPPVNIRGTSIPLFLNVSQDGFKSIMIPRSSDVLDKLERGQDFSKDIDNIISQGIGKGTIDHNSVVNGISGIKALLQVSDPKTMSEIGLKFTEAKRGYGNENAVMQMIMGMGMMQQDFSEDNEQD